MRILFYALFFLLLDLVLGRLKEIGLAGDSDGKSMGMEHMYLYNLFVALVWIAK